MGNVKEIWNRIQVLSLHLPLTPMTSPLICLLQITPLLAFILVNTPPLASSAKKGQKGSLFSFIVLITSIITGGVSIIIIIIIFTHILLFLFFCFFFSLNFFFLNRILAMTTPWATRGLSWRNFLFFFFLHICTTLLGGIPSSHSSIMCCKWILKCRRLTNVSSRQLKLSPYFIYVFSHLIDITCLFLAHAKNCFHNSPCKTWWFLNRGTPRRGWSTGMGWSTRARWSMRSPGGTLSWRR